MKVIPAILTDDINELKTLEKKAEGVVDRIQIDVIDNKFANNKTIDPGVLKGIETKLNLDFHLMVKDPVEWIEHCNFSPNNRIIGQIEYMANQSEFVEKVRLNSTLAGLAIDLSTEVEKIDQDVLFKVDVLLVMSVPAGFGGQEFDLNVWDKIEKITKIRRELNMKFKILVDGGVTKELVNQMKEVGVDEIAVGRRIFEGDLKQNIALFE